MKKRVIRYCALLGLMAFVLTMLFINREKIVETLDIKKMAAGIELAVPEEKKEEKTSKKEEMSNFLAVDMQVTPASVEKTPVEIYDAMSIQERESAMHAKTLYLEYSGLYTYSGDRLSLSKGAIYFNGHKETYYSEKVLPGTTLNIPGRHVAEDGTIRDQEGYICVAANPSYLAKGSLVLTSLGPGKVYDSGCAHGVVDIYVNW